MKLTVKNYRCFSDQHPITIDLSKESTALVGENNTGKSALLRMIRELRPMFANLSNPQTIANVLTGAQRLELQTMDVDPSNSYCLANTRDLTLSLQVDIPDGAGAYTPNEVRVSANRQTNALAFEIRRDGKVLEPHEIAHDYSRDHGPIGLGAATIEYLLPLTTGFVDLSKAKYIGADRNLISQTQGAYYDIQMGTELVSTWNIWKFRGDRRLGLKCRALEERIRKAFDLRRFEIRTNDTRTMLQVAIDDQEFMLNEVGTGIAQYILVGANLLISPCTFALIDEPEANLHPGMQGDFLEMIEDYAEKSVIYSTHSLGLASTYSKEAFITERLADTTTRLHRLEPGTTRNRLMRSLVYSGFVDVGADAVVMVEGPHDVNATKAFLRTLRKRHHGAVLSFSGDEAMGRNMDGYLDELERLVPARQLVFIVDSEQPAANDPIPNTRLAFKAACDRRGIRCFLTTRRAFENYLSERAVQAVNGPSHRALQSFERLDESAPDQWRKSQNALIAFEMTETEILATDLGTFLNENVAPTVEV